MSRLLLRRLSTAQRGRALLGEAEEALSRVQLDLCVDRAEEGLWAVSAGSASSCLSERRALKNVLGIALHLEGNYEAAGAELQAALQLAEETGRRGATHDAFVDLAGCLGDLAANHVALGELDAAKMRVKRGLYMCTNAYRPSACALGCLLSTRGLLEEANDNPQAAVSPERNSNSLPTAPRCPAYSNPAPWPRGTRTPPLAIPRNSGLF